MPIDEKKLRSILTEQEESIKRHVGELIEDSNKKFEETRRNIAVAQEDTRRHAGVLQEETHSKLDLVLEAHQGLSDKMEVEFAALRKELAELRILLFRKADVERLEAAEKRLNALEKHVLRK